MLLNGHDSDNGFDFDSDSDTDTDSDEVLMYLKRILFRRHCSFKTVSAAFLVVIHILIGILDQLFRSNR
jgi:hypothetical protein